MSVTPAVPTLVLGGSGYVAGELLRILVGHSTLRVDAIVSGSRAGGSVVEAFPHLRGTRFERDTFAGGAEIERLVSRGGRIAVFSALPHGEAARRIATLLDLAASAGAELTIVDLSADFRHRDEATYERIYGRPHGAPERLGDFLCALPEHAPADGGGVPHVAHPGCFTTAATLALVPLVAGGWIEPEATVVAVTGSTGAGRNPGSTTHHPERRSNLFAYAPLAHRHEPEMRALVGAATGKGKPSIAFVPHSGPFARGIHATITARAARPSTADELAHAATTFYGVLAPSVRVLDQPPHLQAIVGTNRCELAFAVRDDRVIVFSAIDNLMKGAAGGAVQWMNRRFGLAETSGLALPGLGWL